MRNARGYQSIEGKRLNSRVGIHHENIFIERRIDTNNILDLVEHLELEGSHGRVEVDL